MTWLEKNRSLIPKRDKERRSNQVVIYLLKVNNRNTRTRCEKSSKLTIQTPERRQWRRSGVSLLLNLNIFHTLF